MERLTYRDGHGEAWYSGGTPADHLHRLAEYEDTGLSPQEVEELKAENREMHGRLERIHIAAMP